MVHNPQAFQEDNRSKLHRVVEMMAAHGGDNHLHLLVDVGALGQEQQVAYASHAAAMQVESGIFPLHILHHIVALPGDLREILALLVGTDARHAREAVAAMR